METFQKFCPACGIWKCLTCGKKRYYANRFSQHPLRCKCGSQEGKMLPIAHQVTSLSTRATDHELDFRYYMIGMRVPRYPLEES